MKVDDIHAEKIVNAIVEIDYDYICLINVADSTYIMFNGKRSSDIPDYENHDYDGERIKNTYIYVAEKDRERLLREMSLDYLKCRLEENVKFCTEFDQISAAGIRHKQDVFFYLDDSHKYMILMRKDITDLIDREKESMEKLKKALLEAERAVEAKTSFLANVSHDLRTPLNGVMGFAYAAKEAESIQEKDACLDRIISSGEFLKQIINDTLDLSRNELGVILHPSECTLEEIVNCVENSVSVSAAQKKIVLEFRLPKVSTGSIYADRTRLQQIIMNLVSNAIKFTPEGGSIFVAVKRLKKCRGNANFLISVTDNGIGISEAFLPHVFEPFSQQEGVQMERNMGTGLGLAIVKQDTEAMGGFVEVRSEAGKGTKFEVYLPLNRASHTEEVADNEPDIAFLAGKRALVVEDNEINRLVAAMLLEKRKMSVEYAVNGYEGVKKYRENSEGYFDIIIMDIRMPVMDGLEASRAIRASGKKDASDIPIVAMTANVYDRDVSEIIGAGINAYISKPLVPADMFRIMIELMQNRSQTYV